jgi:uncharacterized OB-fold protein
MTPVVEMARAAAQGKLALQCCAACGRVQYPPREICGACLSDALEWRIVPQAGGELLAETILHHSHDPAFRPRLPLRIGLVRLDAGPSAVCFLAPGCASGGRVGVAAALDEAGRPILTAAPGPDA